MLDARWRLVLEGSKRQDFPQWMSSSSRIFKGEGQGYGDCYSIHVFFTWIWMWHREFQRRDIPRQECFLRFSVLWWHILSIGIRYQHSFAETSIEKNYEHSLLGTSLSGGQLYMSFITETDVSGLFSIKALGRAERHLQLFGESIRLCLLLTSIAVIRIGKLYHVASSYRNVL